MAGKLKPAGAAKKPPKAKKAKAPAGGKKGGPALAVDNTRRGKNTVSRAEAIEHFEEIFELHRELGEVSGEVRKRIGDQYKTVSKKLDMPVKTVRHLFKLEKFRRENEAAEKEFDGRDREGFVLAAQIFGEDTPFGQFAAAAAGRAKVDKFGGSKKAEADTDPDFAEVEE